jgi:HlyD family secretion protein
MCSVPQARKQHVARKLRTAACMTIKPAQISGTTMDQPIAPRAWYRRWRGATLAAAAMALGAGVLWTLLPDGVAVPMAEVRIAPVQRGVFHDDVAVRASAAPLHSILLDAVESGRVEEVFVRDGAQVRRGEPLFRLSNPQRRIEVLAREAEHAQQISNLTNLRVAMEAASTERQRKASDLAFALAQAQKQNARNQALADKGFLSPSAMEDSTDRLAQQALLLRTAQSSNEAEARIQRDAIRQMEQATQRLEDGLRLVHATADALVVRAPSDGRLTDFHLQLGETVKPDQRIGRIDDETRIKLLAQIDEFYLNRIRQGQQGRAQAAGQAAALTVNRIFPQVKDGKFNVELGLAGDALQLLPGQGVDAYITLAAPTQALLLPNDAFTGDSGGAFVYVLEIDGRHAVRRAIRTGRRSHRQLEVLAGLKEGERVIVSSYKAFGESNRLELNGK